jgi:hypothetical protein
MELGKLTKTGFWFKTKKALWWVNPSKDEPLSDDVKGMLITEGELEAADVTSGILTVRGPGDYEAGGVEIRGYAGGVYKIRADGLSVVWADSFSDKWDDKRLDRLDGSDVLVLGVEKTPIARVKQLVKKMGINYLILWGEKDSSAMRVYIDEFDLEGVKQEKIKIEADNLPEGLEVIILDG